MDGIHEKGKVFEDGITHYYDPSKHKWVTEKEIDQKNKSDEISSIMVIVAAVILGGGFLWMLIQTFGS